MTTPTRVRFCPAPSGWLHVGGARTALFNWLHARQQDGTFVLRIEDTDAERATLQSAVGMMEALDWLGLEWDEGPALGDIAARGDHGPYLQSERRPLHDAVVARLLEAGHAYESFETQEELEVLRTAAQAAGEPVAWAHRDLTSDQRSALRAEGRDPVIRVRTPDDGSVSFTDAVRGEVTFDWSEVGDFVIARADGSPTYMLANVVDDLSQGIGFVARGEDLLSATPRQVHMTGLLMPTGILDEALAEVGYPARDPEWPTTLGYAHLPLLVGEDRKKLSKRHGDVAIDAFQADGFLPEVMLNFLALCGWSLDGEHERFSPAELITHFTFDRVQSKPAFFDIVKLRSLNGDAIKELPPQEWADRLVPAFQRAGLVADPPDPADIALITAFAPHLQARAQTLNDAVPFVAFAFSDDVTWDDKAVAKWLKPAAGEVLDFVTPRLEALESWTVDPIMAVFTDAVDQLGVGMGKAMQPVRVVVTGSAVSPPLPETLAALPRDWVMDRIRAGRSRVVQAV